MNKQVHFIGIGGIGMSALARYFLAQKWSVSGSDVAKTDITRELQKEGVNVKIGQKKAHITKKIDLIIHTQAVKPENPEFKAAKQLKIECISYPEAIGKLTKKFETIAIAGAHGKSTTTALTSLMLMKAKLDPTIIIGTKLSELKGKNFRLGKSKYLILEADEFGKAFLHYSPAYAIITNIDKEHLDTYGNFSNVKNNFLKFISRIKNGGGLILNKDDAGLRSIHTKVSGIVKEKRLKVSRYSLSGKNMKLIKNKISIPGKHNLSNACAVFALGKMLNIPIGKRLSAIHDYRGAWRRFEYKGTFEGAPVYDDYAHHPNEIRATLQTFREKYPKKKILCVFQPHHAHRLEALFKEFQSAFDGADEALILPIYRVAGRDEVLVHDSEALVRTIQKNQPKKLLFYLAKPENLKRAIQSLGPLKDKVIVMMGAGNIADYTSTLLDRTISRHSNSPTAH